MSYKEVTVERHKMTVPQFEESYAEVCTRLEAISLQLLNLLPDPSIGPEERLERLARVVPSSMMISARYRTARAKLKDIEDRINELIPGQISSEEKLEILVAQVHQLIPGEKKLIEKLEEYGDHRVSDTGR